MGKHALINNSAVREKSWGPHHVGKDRESVPVTRKGALPREQESDTTYLLLRGDPEDGEGFEKPLGWEERNPGVPTSPRKTLPVNAFLKKTWEER